VTGNGHARFLGGRAAATPLLLPGRAVYTDTEEKKKSNGEVRQVSHGKDVKVREMRRAETFLNIIEDPGKLYEAKVKETRKLESRMMRQVSSPVRRRAGRKGRKNGPRSQPILLPCDTAAIAALDSPGSCTSNNGI
jgi:hypothetical protein